MRWSRTFTVIGMHAEGEVGDVMVSGIVDVPGQTMFEKMKYFEQHEDEIRQMLLFEPRGSPCAAVNVLLPPTDPRADFGYVIMEATKYPVMSGSNTMCVATAILETGMMPMSEPETLLILESPAGLIEARCHCEDGKVKKVELTNQPSFVVSRDLVIEVVGYGTVRVDVCFGGIFFAFIDAADLGFTIHATEAADLVRAGLAIRDACRAQIDPVHPDNPEIRSIHNVGFTGPLERTADGIVSRNAMVIGHGRLDRSPTGTGTAARLALLYAKGEIAINEPFTHFSAFGTRFEAKVIEEVQVGSYPGVVATVAGQAWINCIKQHGIDPTDPFKTGHTPPDIWISQG